MGLGHGIFGLRLHRFQELAQILGHNPARIHEAKGVRQPLGVPVVAVSRDPGCLVDNRFLPLDQPIKQGRLAHVRAPDNCNRWLCHRSAPLHP